MRRSFLNERVYPFVGRIAPEWCVKNHYDVNESWKWNLSSKTEIEMIKKLNLIATDGLSSRWWCKDTLVWLIREQVYDCVSRMSSEAEFNALVETQTQSVIDFDVNAMINALRVYTPNERGLMQLVSMMPTGVLKSIVSALPNLFNDLKIEKLLDGYTTLGKSFDKEYCLLNSLLCANPKRWAGNVIIHMTKEASKHLPKEAREILSEAFEKAINLDLDLSNSLPYLFDTDSSLYRKVKFESYKVKHAAAMVDFLYNRYKSEASIGYRAQKEMEKLLLLLARDDNGAKVVIKHYSLFNKLPLDSEIMSHVFDFITAKLNNMEDWHCLYQQVICADKREMLRAIMPRMITTERDAKLAITYFPFIEWNDDSVKCILRVMVDLSCIPLSRISELSKKLQEFVDYLMVTRSQSLILRRGLASEWVALFNETRLTPAAECVMLTANYERGNEKTMYIKKYGLSEEATLYLLGLESPFEDWCAYIFALAEKQGLTENEYRKVLQSSHADKAPFLAKYKK